MNVPNPFKDQTSMTYQLRSGGNADVKIVIYTIAGRKIRTLTPDPGTPPHAGINYMIWDGRDETGNEIANGTYLYRVVMNGANQDGSSATDAITERAVKSR
jgi:flagellar hook assembly protein FlgD